MDMLVRDRLEYSRLRAKGDATLQARREMLEAHRAALLARQAELADLVAVLDAKITHYCGMESTIERIGDAAGPTCSADGGGASAHRQPRRGAEPLA
jgi:hypothetical protein